jgi:ABC-type transport system substrate-binding protein
VRQKNGQVLNVDLVAFPPYANLATLIQAQLKDIGVQVTPKIIEIPSAVPLIVSGGADAWMLAGTSADPGVLNASFHSRSIGTSPAGQAVVKDPSTDELLDQAAKEMDSGKRCELYNQFQQKFLAHASDFPLIELALPVTANKSVQGVRLDAGIPLLPDLYDLSLTS